MNKFTKKFLAFTLTLLLVFSMGTVVIHSLNNTTTSTPPSSSSASSTSSSSSSSKEETPSSSNSSKEDNSTSKDDPSSKVTSSSEPDLQISSDKKNNLQKSSSEEKIYLNSNYFKDADFLRYLQYNTTYTKDATGWYYTEDQANAVTTIDFHNSTYTYQISNLTGIEYFTNLKTLNCSNNELTSLDLSHNTNLTTLACENNHLAVLNIQNLTYLNGTNYSRQTLKNKATLYIGEDNKYKVDMKTIVGSNNIGNISGLGSSWSYDSTTGIATYNGSNIPTTINYAYEALDNGTDDTFYRLLVKVNLLNFVDNVYINSDNFPDAGFRNYLLNNTTHEGGNIDNGTAYFTLSQLENVRAIATALTNVSDLKGIEYFTNLYFLDCNNNKLTSLDLSNNTKLKHLYCSNNELTASTLILPEGDTLLDMEYRENHLTWLDLSKNTYDGPQGFVYCPADGQTASTNYNMLDDNYTVDIGVLVGDKSKVRINYTDVDNWDYNSDTGLATYKHSSIPYNTNLTYNYDATNANGHVVTLTVKLTLSARFEQYTVSFNSNGGTPVDDQIVNKGSSATIPDPPPTKDGCVFYAWFKDGDDTSFDFDNTPITENLTLNATWNCNVTFNLDGGSIGGSPDNFTSTVAENDTVNQPESPIKDGCNFAGWYEDEALTKKFDFNTPINHSLNLYAKYEKTEPVNPSNDSQAANSASNNNNQNTNDDNSSVNSSATGQDITLLTVCIAVSFISIALISIVITHRKKHNK